MLVIQRMIFLVIFFLGISFQAFAASSQPVYIGLDAEFGHTTSTSPEAIKRGILIAIEEINKSGGVLRGRPLALEIRDNRSVPARALVNIRELATNPDIVAIFTGKFSPVVQESIPLVHELEIPLLDPWAAADNIVDNGRKPNFVFRLSLKDEWALDAMMSYATEKGAKRIGLMLPNTGWGRSSMKAAQLHVDKHRSPIISLTEWYNWGDKSMLSHYRALKDAGAEVIILVANETEGSILVKEVAALPSSERLPIVSHWGVTGGEFFKLASSAIKDVDFSVVQTYSFIDVNDPAANRVVEAAKRLFGVRNARELEAPVGVAHAYDLTHILAKAINLAGSTDRKTIRSALEKIKKHKGLVKNYHPAFTPSQHEALSRENVFMARFDSDGAIVRIPTKR